MVDADGNITYLNRRAEEILDVAVQEGKTGHLAMNGRHITDRDGKTMPPSKRPFPMIRKTQQPLYDSRCCLNVSPEKKRLLSINGEPVQGADDAFEGAVLTVGVIDET
jgi:PAS domain-containing protein